MSSGVGLAIVCEGPGALAVGVPSAPVPVSPSTLAVGWVALGAAPWLAIVGAIGRDEALAWWALADVAVGASLISTLFAGGASMTASFHTIPNTGSRIAVTRSQNTGICLVSSTFMRNAFTQREVEFINTNELGLRSNNRSPALRVSQGLRVASPLVAGQLCAWSKRVIS